MTVWYRPYFLPRGQHRILTLCLFLFLVVVSTAIVSRTQNTFAAPSTISFSARLKAPDGSVVPNGHYNVEFKLYNQQSSGTAVWSEAYYDHNGAAEGQDHRVHVVNGYLSVKLGSRQAFDEQVNWGDSLWLTMNIGGTSQTTTPNDTNWDGEMTPRIQLGAVPFAMNASQVGGKSASQLVQLGQGVQTDASTGTSSIFINKTGTGNLLELQSAGINSFTLDQAGSITLGSTTSQSISIADSSTGSGQRLTIAAGSSVDTTSGDGGALVLQGGDASGTDARGGDVAIDTGDSTGTAEGGTISIGTLNAGKVAIGNINSTTTIDGGLQSSNLDATESSTSLNIGQLNATEINLGQDTTIADGKTLTVGGDTTIRNDSTSALRVQDSTGANQLTVDTTNNRIRIGTNDTIASLLVLDTKTTDGDPSGTNGAMYYSAAAGKFRCFQDGGWVDCITPLPVSKNVATDIIINDTAEDVSDLAFDLSPHTKYYYKFIINSDTTSTSNGLGFGVTTPDNPDSSHWCVNTTATLESTSPGTPGWGSYCGTGDVYTTTIGEDTPGNMYASSMEGYIQTGTTAGKLQLRAMSETTDDTTIRQGSFGILQVVQ